MELQESRYDVVIIGAGISGIACASALLESNVPHIILEAKDRIGGRINTVNLGNEKIDLGASYIHGLTKENPIYKLSQKLKLKMTNPIKGKILTFYKDGKNIKNHISLKDIKNIEEYYNRVIEKIDKTKAKVLNQADENKKIEDFTVRDSINHILSSDPKLKKLLTPELNKNYWNFLEWTDEEYEGCEFNEESLLLWKSNRVKGGNGALEKGYLSLLEPLTKGLNIKLSCEVRSIENYDTNEIKIVTNQGVFIANKVVLSVPLGVLKSNLISFLPELPNYKKECIERLKMGLMNKVVLLFEKKFWEDDLETIQYFSETKGEFPWIDNYSRKDPILYCWLAGSYAEHIETLEDQEIIEKILKILKSIYSEGKVSKVVNFHITRWRSDPYSKGSYSYFSKGSKVEDHEILGQNVENLYFCGEATCKEHLGTVHGAYISGKNVAKQILKNR